MQLKGKKILILVETFYNEFEFWYPYYRLKEAGAQVTVVGSGSAETYKSKAGLPVTVDTTAEKVVVADYEGVVIPGGYAPDHMRRYPAMVDLVKGFA
jgi:protease I